MPLVPDEFMRLGVSLGLGLLVGMQRQRRHEGVAGVRTFGLITLLGTASAMLAADFGGWIVAAALLGVSASTLIGTALRFRAGQHDYGITTEIAALLMFAVGALLGVGDPVVAIVLGGTVAVLLQLKGPLHSLVRGLADSDVRAIFQFVLITLVILPVVPDQSFGPYDVLNAHNVWLMVVLVVGISLGGYLAYKALGASAGSLLGGILGGIISSTATTVSYSKRIRGTEAPAHPVVVVLLLATGVMYARVIVELSALAPAHLSAMAPPIVVLGCACGLLGLGVWIARRHASVSMPEPENPAELKPALAFAAVYAIVLVLVAWARDRVGDAGTYAVAAVSGVADMDAITLSAARLTTDGDMTPDTAWRAIVIASLSNMVFKTGVAWALGGWHLAWRLGLALAGAALVGVALLLAW